MRYHTDRSVAIWVVLRPLSFVYRGNTSFSEVIMQTGTTKGSIKGKGSPIYTTGAIRSMPLDKLIIHSQWSHSPTPIKIQADFSANPQLCRVPPLPPLYDVGCAMG